MRRATAIIVTATLIDLARFAGYDELRVYRRFHCGGHLASNLK